MTAGAAILTLHHLHYKVVLIGLVYLILTYTYTLNTSSAFFYRNYPFSLLLVKYRIYYCFIENTIPFHEMPNTSGKMLVVA